MLVEGVADTDMGDMSVTAITEARAALDAAGQLPEDEIELGAVALQLARVDQPELDIAAAGALLSDIARRAVDLAIRNKQADAGDAELRRALLAGLIHDEFGFAGDADSYDDLANANLSAVLDRRLGLPVALGIIWLHAAEAAGWAANGIDFPGHFLLALNGTAGPALVDVFHAGRRLEAPDLRALVKRIEGPKAELRPGMMVAMGKRAVLLRLQNNIKLRRLRAHDIEGALACVEDMTRLAPMNPLLWREAGLMHNRLERIGAALVALEKSLALAPQAEGAQRIRELVEELRHRLN